MRIGEVFRYSRPYSPAPAQIDGLTNYFYATFSPGQNLPLLDRGINPIREVMGPEGPRRPAILISSSPHKIGSYETPWQDFFDADNGHIRYYGDNKQPGRDPTLSLGNKVLIEAFRLHSSPDYERRKHSVPIVFFRRVGRDGKAKGYVQFQGFGIVHRIELVTQYDRRNDRTFSNFMFDFAVLSLAAEHEFFDWMWITARRNPSCGLEDTLQCAPESWREWVRSGVKAIERCRRRVSKLMTDSVEEQRPRKGSREENALNEIYRFYRNRRARFEGLAAVVTARVINKSGWEFRIGWVTPPSSDGGADFVGRLDIGTGFERAKLVVLGQAKCERPDRSTGGRHIARTVARDTSRFSPPESWWVNRSEKS